MHMPQWQTANASIPWLESNIAKFWLEITKLRQQVASRDKAWPLRAKDVGLCRCCVLCGAPCSHSPQVVTFPHIATPPKSNSVAGFGTLWRLCCPA